jgi:low temperature requirement protein LtrA
MQPRLRGAEEQGATFVELFFDLVFVFAVTQVAGVLAHDPTWMGVFHGLVIFWLVWWAWTQYTWSLNEADTEHHAVRLITLTSTAIAFVMAVTIPVLAEPIGWLFPLSYLILRITGIGLQWLLAGGDSEWARAVRVWTLTSSAGLIAVVGAILLPPQYRYQALAVAALLDVGAALRAGRNEWRLYPKHFAERHGLFVIIALGEALIAAGVSATGQDLDEGLLVVTVTVVAAACGLWWTYFGWAKDALEAGLVAQPAARVGRYARDVYSFAHYPLLFGVIGFAVAIEEAMAHPKTVLEPSGVVALIAGVLLFIGGTALALALGGVKVPLMRWVGLAVIAASTPLALAAPAWLALSVVAGLVILLALVERPVTSAV